MGVANVSQRPYTAPIYLYLQLLLLDQNNLYEPEVGSLFIQYLQHYSFIINYLIKGCIFQSYLGGFVIYLTVYYLLMPWSRYMMLKVDRLLYSYTPETHDHQSGSCVVWNRVLTGGHQPHDVSARRLYKTTFYHGKLRENWDRKWRVSLAKHRFQQKRKLRLVCAMFSSETNTLKENHTEHWRYRRGISGFWLCSVS